MLLFYLFLSIGISFLCSLFEAVILSVTPAYAANLAGQGRSAGKLLKRLKDNVDDSLSAILTLNTIAHTIGAAGVGAEVLKLYGDKYVAIASVILTLLILVLSEIIPKTLGANYYRFFASFAAYGIQAFIIFTYPFVKSFKYLSKLMGAKGHAHQVTRDEIIHTAMIGKEGGDLSEDEVAIISNLLRLRKVLVKDIMTPRTVVFALQEDMTVGDVLKEHPSIPYSRIPVYGSDKDHLTGLLNRYELSQHQAQGQLDIRIADLAKEIHSVPDTINIARVLDTFIKRGDHLFAVYDEHGGLDGVITLEDIIETILGIEITDEFDNVDDLRKYAADQWAKKRKKLAKK